MKVKILCEFDVPGADDERVAKSAASQAAYDYLAFCTALDCNPGRAHCAVHVDGIGLMSVSIGDDHE